MQAMALLPRVEHGHALPARAPRPKVGLHRWTSRVSARACVKAFEREPGLRAQNLKGSGFSSACEAMDFRPIEFGRCQPILMAGRTDRQGGKMLSRTDDPMLPVTCLSCLELRWPNDSTDHENCEDTLEAQDA